MILWISSSLGISTMVLLIFLTLRRSLAHSSCSSQLLILICSFSCSSRVLSSCRSLLARDIPSSSMSASCRLRLETYSLSCRMWVRAVSFSEVGKVDVLYRSSLVNAEIETGWWQCWLCSSRFRQSFSVRKIEFSANTLLLKCGNAALLVMGSVELMQDMAELSMSACFFLCLLLLPRLLGLVLTDWKDCLFWQQHCFLSSWWGQQSHLRQLLVDLFIVFDNNCSILQNQLRIMQWQTTIMRHYRQIDQQDDRQQIILQCAY